MKKFKTGNAATKPHKDQRPASSEKHLRNDGYEPTRFRNRIENALQNADALMRPEKNKDITVMLKHVVFGDVKHYPTILRANVKLSDPHERTFSLKWNGNTEKQEFQVSQYDHSTEVFTLIAKFYLEADSAASHQVRLLPEFQGIEIWNKATSRTQQNIWWAFELSLEGDEQVKRSKLFWDHVSYYLKRKSLQELQCLNLVREGDAYQIKTRAATHQPRFTLEVPGEKYLWSFTGCLIHTEFLQARDSLRRVIVRNAPGALLDGMEEESECDKNMRDVDEEETANRPQSQDPNPEDHSTHHHSSGRPTTQYPPRLVYGAESRSAIVQTQQHHTPKRVLLDGSAPTGRDKRQKATTARRS